MTRYPSPEQHGHIVIPILNSPSLADVKLLFLLTPLWWVLGIEQIIWPIILSYSCIKILLVRKRIRVSSPLILLLLFIGSSLISGFFIIEPLRIITFMRNLSGYLSALFLFIVITNSIQTWRKLTSLIHVTVISMACISVIGLLAILNIYRGEFPSLVGTLIPGSLAQTDYARRIISRSVGNIDWFSFFGQYFRVSSTFLFATLYASALSITIPLTTLMIHYSRGIRKLIYIGILLSLVTNLLFTTGRSAIFALAIGGVYWAFDNRAIPKIAKLSGFALSMIIILVLALSPPASGYQGSLGHLLTARGSSSRDRLFIYSQTLAGMVERPLFGWGTERDIPDFPFPAGSHSYFLGAVYKYGIIGAFIFIALWVSVWKSTYRRSDLKHLPFMSYMRWIILTAGLNSMTDVLDLDLVTLMLLWSVFAIIAAANLIPDPPLRAWGTRVLDRSP